MINLFSLSQFDQCVLNMALIHLCNHHSEVGQAMRKQHYTWLDERDEPTRSPWFTLHQFTIAIPHPAQQYEGMTLEEGLTKGYNIEVKAVEDRSPLPYAIPQGGHFVVILKQKELDADFSIAATGIFVRPLALLSLDWVIDPVKPEYQSFLVKHPIIREYPTDWEQKLRLWMAQNGSPEDLPDLVGYVDQAFNRDYYPPSWQDVYLAAKGFAGV